MTVVAPTTTRPQCLRAIDRANAVRIARSKHKRRLADARNKAASLDLCADLLLEAPDEVKRMTLGALLASCYGVGPAEAHKLLGRMNPPASATLRLEHLAFPRAMELAAVLRRAR